MSSKPKSEAHVLMFMDAMPFNIGFELDDLRIIEMQQRHCFFELKMTEAAEDMLGIEPPHDFAKNLDFIEDTIRRVRNREKLECKEAFPAAVVGVLWGWQLVSELNWNWCAVSQDWWETLAVTDDTQQHVILPVQYCRRIAGETGHLGKRDEQTVEKWPRDIVEDIRTGALPASDEGKPVFVF